MDRIRRGDSRALEAIFVEYHKNLVLLAEIHVPNRGMAEDIVSTVLVNLLKNAENYGNIENPDAWMFSAVKHTAIDYMRRYGNEVPIEYAESDFTIGEEGLSFRLAFRQEMGTYTERRRDIVYLYYICGLKLHETAKTLNVSLSTVKREICALKEQLKKFLKNF